ncbi:MAG: flavin reductase family protein [Planctomycetes bacterium]|nr:flavin reductase family protein [Planctomycetota bacterium]
MQLDPSELAQKDRYRLLIGLVVPRPIAFVSTVSRDGVTNLAPYSFFNGLASEPLSVLFCPANRPDGGEKDTLANCKPESEGGTGEFVVNASIEGYAAEIALAAEPLPHGESEFDLTGLATAPSTRVKPPRVARSPWAFECETLQIVRLAPGVPNAGNVVIGRVVRIHVDDAVLDAKLRVDYDRLAAIGRLGGIAYCKTRERFELAPGKTGSRASA